MIGRCCRLIDLGIVEFMEKFRVVIYYLLSYYQLVILGELVLFWDGNVMVEQQWCSVKYDCELEVGVMIVLDGQFCLDFVIRFWSFCCVESVMMIWEVGRVVLGEGIFLIDYVEWVIE